MTNVTPTARNPVTDRQMAAALALADILDHGLPAIHWHISETSPGKLVGQVSCFTGTEAERDAQERQDVQAFAQFLGAAYHETNCGGWTLAEVIGVYEGVPVRVWANVDDLADIAKEAAATEPPKDGVQDATPVSA